MANNVKDLCRFCGKTKSLSKDLIGTDNTNVLKFIQDVVNITVTAEDKLPTKICLDCEEKMLSFQIFILECIRVQDSLHKMILSQALDYQSSVTIDIHKEENDEFSDSCVDIVKHEVKDEFPIDDDFTESITQDESFNSMDGSSHNDDDIDSDSNDEEIPLKLLKRKRLKKKPVTEEETVKFKELLKQRNPKVKDFVKLICHQCNEDCNTWSSLRIHFAKEHKSSPVVYCICGSALTSKSVLYKHVSDHKLENKRLNKDCNDIQESKYAALKVDDFVNLNCMDCTKKFSSWYKLKSHCQRCHKKPIPIVQCICGFSIKSKSVLYKHISDHKNPNILSCDKCGTATKTLSALHKHKMKHIPKAERVYKCDSCSKIFNTKEALKSHTKSHIPITERKVFDCNYCDLKFTTRSSAISHRRVVHEKIKSYVCDLCGYSCGTCGELKQHRAIHSDDKPYACTTCTKRFKTYSNLKTHMDTHGETSYTCYVCNRILNSRRTLRKHLLVHEEKCQHVCSYCNKAFKRRQTLKVHLYTHTGDKPLSCRWCDDRFAYASTLRSHRLRCHPDKMNPPHQNNQPYLYKVSYQDIDMVKNDSAVGFPKNDADIMTIR